MQSKNTLHTLKPGKSLFQTLIFLVALFVISTLPLLLNYLLKNINPQEYGLLRGKKEDLEITYKEILFFSSLIFACFVLSVSLWPVKNRKLRTIFSVIALFYLVAAFIMVLVDVIHYLIFAYRITFSSVQTVLNTDTEEVKGFIKLYYSSGSLFSILAFILFILLVVLKRKWFITLFSTRVFLISSFLITAFGIIDFIQVAHSEGNGTHNMRYWDIIIGDYNEYRAFNRKLEAEKNNHNQSKEYTGFYQKDTAVKTIVLVISESLSKRHMSMYGYPRITTPHLDTNRLLMKYNNCVSQAALTIDAVPGLFFNGHFTRRINLITILNKLNYETTWISNQSGWGKIDGTIVLLSQLCKRVIFLDSLADDNKSNTSLHLDEGIVDQFQKVLNAPGKKSKLIVLHFMGCHYDYEKRYPSNRNFFNGQAPVKPAVSSPQIYKTLNTYDNAVHYHDSVINEVVKVFSKQDPENKSVLLFLSDHGEELYENRNHAGHGYPPVKVTSEIPMFTLLSPGFKKKYSQLEATLSKRKNTPYSSSNNFYTLLHLLNINSKNYETKIRKNAFYSADYDSMQPRMVMGIDYSKMEF